MKMSLRDDVRWVCDAADGLLVGWLPGRLPKWATKEGEKLGWLVLLLWQKFYDASMARGRLEAEAARLRDDVDGLRTTNERLTDMLEEPQREVAASALAAMPPGYYWVAYDVEAPMIAYWSGSDWQCAGTTRREHENPPLILSGKLVPPRATPP